MNIHRKRARADRKRLYKRGFLRRLYGSASLICVIVVAVQAGLWYMDYASANSTTTVPTPEPTNAAAMDTTSTPEQGSNDSDSPSAPQEAKQEWDDCSIHMGEWKKMCEANAQREKALESLKAKTQKKGMSESDVLRPEVKAALERLKQAEAAKKVEEKAPTCTEPEKHFDSFCDTYHFYEIPIDQDYKCLQHHDSGCKAHDWSWTRYVSDK